MILLLTHKVDLCADIALPRLESLCRQVVRVNVEDYPLDISLTYNLRPDTAVNLCVYGKKFDLSDVEAVWYRVPFEYSVRRWTKDHQVARFIESSCNHMWYPLELLLPNCFWFDQPLAVIRASYKLNQLSKAVQVGLDIPKTCATNDPSSARHFYDSLGGQMIIKTMCGGGIQIGDRIHVVYTNPVSLVDMQQVESISECPCQLQEYVSKEFELRVIVVEDKTFAVEIHSQRSDKAKHDWRHYDLANVPHVVHSLPAEVHKKCVAITRELGLHYGAIDMVVTPTGDYVFLEINPTGQYQWLEALTGLPITDALVETLLAHSSPKDRGDSALCGR